MTGKFDITKFCDRKCRPNYGLFQHSGKDPVNTKLVSGGNDPTMTKAMKYAMYVRNTKPGKVNVGVWLANHPNERPSYTSATQKAGNCP